MPTQQTLVAFALVSVGIVIMPGPSNLFLLAHGIGHGRGAAMAAMTGISAASAIRVMLTAAGLSAALASSAVVFAVVQWAGVGYLVYLGVRAFRSDPEPGSAGGRTGQVHLGRSAGRGLVVGLGNPKMLIFFVAFLPQFVDPSRGSQATQILVLGAVFWVIGVLWDLTFAYLSGTIGGWLDSRPGIRRLQPPVEGSTFLGLAVWAATAGARA